MGVDPEGSAPPPAEIPRLIDDLISFADDDQSDLDAVSRAALAHAQFEAIHPYGDGNGRLGRVLVSRVLRRSGVTARSTAPISVAIAQDPGGYLSGLHLFERGDHGPWVRWFAESATRAATAAEHLVKQAGHLLSRWDELTTELRADHTARALLHRLPPARLTGSERPGCGSAAGRQRTQRPNRSQCAGRVRRCVARR